METYLALDLGGTKLLIGEVGADGRVLRHQAYPSGYADQQEAVGIICRSLDDYIERVGWATADRRPVAMGVGLPGRIDTAQGIWLQLDPERTQPTALAALLQDKYGMPCRLDNDVKCATQAELRWGAGLTARHFVYINVGTGLAAGTVVDGRLLRGAHFNAGEVGHISVGGVATGTTCVCGATDCVEAIASGSGLDLQARRLHADYPDTALALPPVGERIAAARIFELCRRGDALCRVLVDQAAQALAGLIMTMVRVADPEVVVLGGGVVADGFLLGQASRRLNPKTMRFVSGGVRLSILDPQFVGLLGAASVAIK